MRDRLKIEAFQLEAINSLLANPDSDAISALLDVVNRYGSPKEINSKAEEARKLENLLDRLERMASPYLKDIKWLIKKRDEGAFISVKEYREKVLGKRASSICFRDDHAVTLEISAAQYFPWIVEEAKKAIERKELMPGRFIRVRKMKEQEEDDGDILAFAAAMQVMGASWVETLDTKGTDGSNVHLNGPATITGYFGGIGQPNDYPLKWVDELLYYYTNYGVNQVLNTNAGTILLGFLLYKLGIDIQFKISVFVGIDNPFSALWTLIGAKLFAREDGTSPLIGMNWSNSVNNRTIELAAQFRKALGFEDVVRFEHHITEAWKSIVRQPYDRREELLQLAATVKNISAKHEGGDVEVERRNEANARHTSDILDYFRSKAEILESGDWDNLLRNYLEKHDALNNTARALTERGLSFVAAPKLHHREG
ncbi:MAG TPA: hypothetical protein GXX40_09260 [Firmicutes bacterium]|nr:hypothetical protein [Bacillota bacterium]